MKLGSPAAMMVSGPTNPPDELDDIEPDEDEDAPLSQYQLERIAELFYAHMLTCSGCEHCR